METDIHVHDMMEILSFMQPMPPVTVKKDQWGSTYPSQKEHMMDWLLGQTDETDNPVPFTYTRKVSNESGRTAYNRFLNPGGLLWVAEVLGESEETLTKAAQAAAEAEKVNYRSRCAAFRKVISFDRIMELLDKPEGWLYDPRIYPMLVFDENGQPFVKEEYEDQYMDIIEEEWQYK